VSSLLLLAVLASNNGRFNGFEQYCQCRAKLGGNNLCSAMIAATTNAAATFATWRLMHKLHFSHNAACGAYVQEAQLYTEVRIATDEDIAANQNFRADTCVSVHDQRTFCVYFTLQACLNY
jgi:type IV secretory pathway TraG/TraD family ATPase VirD4